MSTFHCWSGDFTLETRFYLSLQFGSCSLCSSENNAFSVMCDVCRKPVKRVFWAQIPRDICTRFEHYLYLTESSWILILYIYLLVSNPNPSSVTSRCILGLPGCQVGMIANVVCTIMFYTFLFSEPISPRQLKKNSKHKNIPFIKWLELVLSLLMWLV